MKAANTNSREFFSKLQEDVDNILRDFRNHLRDDDKDDLFGDHFNVDLILKNEDWTIERERIVFQDFEERVPNYRVIENSPKTTISYPARHNQVHQSNHKKILSKINSTIHTIFKGVESKKR